MYFQGNQNGASRVEWEGRKGIFLASNNDTYTLETIDTFLIAFLLPFAAVSAAVLVVFVVFLYCCLFSPFSPD